MINALARGEMNTIVLPMQAVMFGCALMASLGSFPLLMLAHMMRDSRDPDMRRNASAAFGLGMAALIAPLIMVIACLFIYQSQGGFE